MTLTRRAALMGLAVLPVGCGDGEPEHRRAFIAFLQQRIVDKPGIHLARPTPEEAKSWGDYVKHYAIITDFNDNLSKHVSKPLEEATNRGMVRSVQELMARRADVAEVRSGMAALRTELDKQFAAAEAAHAALSQPADLKAVFDAAYERDVAGPARALQAIFPVADRSFATALELADYIAQHPRGVQVQGSVVQVSDPVAQRELSTRMNAMNEASQQAVAAQQTIQKLVRGE